MSDQGSITGGHVVSGSSAPPRKAGQSDIDFRASVDGTFTLSISDGTNGVTCPLTAPEVFALMAAMITVVGQFMEYGLATTSAKKARPEQPALLVPRRPEIIR